MLIDRSWALNWLRHNRNSFILTLAAASLLKSDAVLTLQGRFIVIKPNEMIFNAEPSDCVGKRHDISLDQIVRSARDDAANFAHDITEMLLRARRNLVKESFEVVQAYANAVGLRQVLKSMPWFSYCRVIRNCISHDLHFRFRPHDLTQLPVNYQCVNIDSALNGHEMQQDHLPFFVAVELLAEMEAFVSSGHSA